MIILPPAMPVNEDGILDMAEVGYLAEAFILLWAEEDLMRTLNELDTLEASHGEHMGYNSGTIPVVADEDRYYE